MIVTDEEMRLLIFAKHPLCFSAKLSKQIVAQFKIDLDWTRKTCHSGRKPLNACKQICWTALKARPASLFHFVNRIGGGNHRLLWNIILKWFNQGSINEDTNIFVEWLALEYAVVYCKKEIIPKIFLHLLSCQIMPSFGISDYLYFVDITNNVIRRKFIYLTMSCTTIKRRWYVVLEISNALRFNWGNRSIAYCALENLKLWCWNLQIATKKHVIAIRFCHNACNCACKILNIALMPCLHISDDEFAVASNILLNLYKSHIYKMFQITFQIEAVERIL